MSTTKLTAKEGIALWNMFRDVIRRQRELAENAYTERRAAAVDKAIEKLMMRMTELAPIYISADDFDAHPIPPGADARD